MRAGFCPLPACEGNGGRAWSPTPRPPIMPKDGASGSRPASTIPPSQAARHGGDRVASGACCDAPSADPMASSAPFVELDTEAGRVAGRAWLREVGCQQPEAALEALQQILDARVTDDLLALLGQRLAEQLPQIICPDLALQRLARFTAAVRSPTSLLALFDRDPEALPTLLRIFSLSAHLSQNLIDDPDCFDILRVSGGQSIAREIMVDELTAEVQHAESADHVAAILEQFRSRETMRIAYGDFIRGLPIERTTEQLSLVVDAILEAAVDWVRRRLAAAGDEPLSSAGQPASLTVLGLGKLGGRELSYGSAIELVFLSEPVRAIDSFSKERAAHFFQQLAEQVLDLIAHREAGPRYTVDGRRRPYGRQGPLVISSVEASRYY